MSKIEFGKIQRIITPPKHKNVSKAASKGATAAKIQRRVNQGIQRYKDTPTTLKQKRNA